MFLVVCWMFAKSLTLSLKENGAHFVECFVRNLPLRKHINVQGL